MQYTDNSSQPAVFRSKIQDSSDKNVRYTILSLLGLNIGKKRITPDDSRAVRYGMY